MHTPCPIPAAGIAAATALMESGRLYRYNSPSPAECPVCEVEERLKAYTGHRHCLALNSCGSALYLALLTAGAKPGDKVATNAFTFGAVPSAIWHAGGEPVYLETADNYVVCPDTLEAALAREEAKGEPVRFLMLSHMRGKIADLPRVAAICKARGVVLLEDCAHSLGVTFDGEHTGHRALSCGVSSQAYKMLNSGEGGFLLTNDAEVYAKAMVSGSDKRAKRPQRGGVR
jgi:dTDP-4-amino-4,6-dideoxygalactose transaminase